MSIDTDFVEPEGLELPKILVRAPLNLNLYVTQINTILPISRILCPRMRFIASQKAKKSSAASPDPTVGAYDELTDAIVGWK